MTVVLRLAIHVPRYITFQNFEDITIASLETEVINIVSCESTDTALYLSVIIEMQKNSSY